jgi:hypothetical protein
MVSFSGCSSPDAVHVDIAKRTKTARARIAALKFEFVPPSSQEDFLMGPLRSFARLACSLHPEQQSFKFDATYRMDSGVLTDLAV